MPAGKARLKEIVDGHMHREGFSLAMLEIEVEDRVVASGLRTVKGIEVAGASGGFLDMVDGGRIPFHRVRAVRSAGKEIYRRGGKG